MGEGQKCGAPQVLADGESAPPSFPQSWCWWPSVWAADQSSARFGAMGTGGSEEVRRWEAAAEAAGALTAAHGCLALSHGCRTAMPLMPSWWGANAPAAVAAWPLVGSGGEGEEDRSPRRRSWSPRGRSPRGMPGGSEGGVWRTGMPRAESSSLSRGLAPPPPDTSRASRRSSAALVSG